MKDLIKFVASSSVALVLANITPIVAAQGMPTGLWELKAKAEIPGMPADVLAKMAAQTVTHCVVAGKNNWSDERSTTAQHNCERSDMKVSGNEISWKIKCKEGISGEGSVKHNNKDAYTMNITMNSPGRIVKIETFGKLLASSCEKK